MMTKKIVLASGNAKKINELHSLLDGSAYQIIPQSDFNTPEADENGLSFIENAIIKARNACIHSGLPSIADDSGLEVDALKGRPGIYSARFSGENATDTSNNQQLLEQMLNIPALQRTARFQCLLVYMRHAEDPTPIICQGSWEGTILTTPQGDNGFGYDSLFYLTEQQCSSAQLTADIKNTLSHRGIAMKKLLQYFKTEAL